MMKQGELMQEVSGVIEARLTNNEPAAMTWIVHEVVRRHQGIVGPDSDFYVLCAYEHVHRTVREVLRSRRSDEERPEPAHADLFPGFKRLQRSYTIPRGDEQVVVRLEQMTPEEIRAKARELRSMATGAMAHAQELEDYMSARGGAQAVA